MRISVHGEFDFPAERVWALLRDFGNQDYLTALYRKVETSGSGVGMLRRIYRRGDNTPMIHRLDLLDDAAMHQAFTVLQSRIVPTAAMGGDMTGDIRLRAEAPGRCSGELVWTLTPPADADPELLRALLLGFSEAIIQQLVLYLQRGDDLR